jgi:LPXTG-site transpeptidase (sortase) family protein
VRALTSFLGSVLVVGGLVGLVFTSGVWRPQAYTPRAGGSIGTGSGVEGPAAVEIVPTTPPDPGAADALGAPPDLSIDVSADGEPAKISAIAVPRLGLRSVVLPAPIVGVPGGTTWDVPAFVVGHGENTAGPGQAGNAVLLGHVTSPNAGSIFKDVHLMRRGDSVQLFSGPREFAYVVTEVRIVPRTDLSVLVPTETATLTLVTCTGAWLPALQDFSHRLAIRAELAVPAAAH